MLSSPICFIRDITSPLVGTCEMVNVPSAPLWVVSWEGNSGRRRPTFLIVHVTLRDKRGIKEKLFIEIFIT